MTGASAVLGHCNTPTEKTTMGKKKDKKNKQVVVSRDYLDFLETTHEVLDTARYEGVDKNFVKGLERLDKIAKRKFDDRTTPLKDAVAAAVYDALTAYKNKKESKAQKKAAKHAPSPAAPSSMGAPAE